MRLTIVVLTVLSLAFVSAPACAVADTVGGTRAENEWLSWGCLGGFTGGGGGIDVYRDGEIHRWSRPTHRDRIARSFLIRDRAAARAVFEEVERIDFTSIDHKEFGNMTCSLTLHRDTWTHDVSWPIDDPSMPSAIAPLVEMMKELEKHASGADRAHGGVSPR